MSPRKTSGPGWALGRSTARGRVFKHGRTWHYQVSDSTGKVVSADNTGAFAPMIDAASTDVAAVRVIENKGHRLMHSYYKLVDIFGEVSA